MPDEEVRPNEKPPLPVVSGTMAQETLPTGRIKPLYRVTQIVWYILGLIEALLLLRLILKALAANPEAGFTKFIYGVTWLFANPFLSVFGSSRVEGNILEWSTILAMVVYALLAWLIVKAIVMSRPVSTKEAARKLPTQEKM